MGLHRVKFGRALRLAVLELMLLVIGMIFVRREIWEFHAASFDIQHWQEGLLLPFAVIDGSVTGAYGSRRRNVEHVPAYARTLRWARPIFFLLYVACCALCERVNFGVFTIVPEMWRTLGLALVVAGLYLRVLSATSSPSALMRDEEPAAVPQAEAGSKSEAAAGSKSEVETGSQSEAQSRSQSDAETASQSEAGTGSQSEAGTGSQSEAEIGSRSEADIGSQSEAGASSSPQAGAASKSETETSSSPVSGTPSKSQADLTSKADADKPTISILPETGLSVLPQFPSGPYRILRYPDAAARMLMMAGLAFVFNSWFSLLVVPGVLVLVKWHIKDQEAFRISQLGEPYLLYKKRTWNLIPFIY